MAPLVPVMLATPVTMTIAALCATLWMAGMVFGIGLPMHDDPPGLAMLIRRIRMARAGNCGGSVICVTPGRSPLSCAAEILGEMA